MGATHGYFECPTIFPMSEIAGFGGPNWKWWFTERQANMYFLAVGYLEVGKFEGPTTTTGATTTTGGVCVY